jgi:hypothetical protein
MKRQLDPNWIIAGFLVGVVLTQQYKKHTRSRQHPGWVLRKKLQVVRQKAWPLAAKIEAPRAVRKLDSEWASLDIDNWTEKP